MHFVENERIELKSTMVADICKEVVRRMIKETDGDSFESSRSLEQNLTFESATNAFMKRGVGFDAAKMKTLGIISTDGVYSNVGLLLSDQCPSTIKAATFAGSDPIEFQDRREFLGSLFQQMEETHAYLDMRNQTKATFEGLYRRDTRDYPEEAMREALLNALVHRDYSYRASTLISVYADRTEFVSIGGLPSGVDVEDIMLGLSLCRNSQLAIIFYRLKLIEAYGTGMPKIINAYKDSLVKPKIEVTNNAFKITLPNRNVMLPSRMLLNKPEARILSYLHDQPFILRSDVEELLGVSQATSNRILKRMLRQGDIQQDGGGRTTRYRRK